MGDLFLFRATLRGMFKPQKVLLALLLVVAPAAIALGMRLASKGTFEAGPVYNQLASGLVFGFLLVITSIVFGTGVLAAELEQKTIVYLLTRPVARWRLLLVKFAAALLVVVLLLWVSILALALVTFGPSRLGGSPLGKDLAILPLGAAAYGLVSLLISTVLPRPLLWGLMYAFGWETWVPSIPGHFQKLSLMAYLRVLAPHPVPEGESVDILQLLGSRVPETISAGLARTVLTLVILISLAASLVIFSQREYVPRDE